MNKFHSLCAAVLFFNICLIYCVSDASDHKQCYSGYCQTTVIERVAVSEKEKNDFLKIHNDLRREYGIEPLQWDETLAESALIWAKKLAQAGELYHSKTPDKGENLYWGASNFGKVYTLAEAAQSWGDEKSLQHGKKFDPRSKAGHYTQMIWRNTKRVGAAIVRRGYDYYIVAHYSPAGNWIGQDIY